MDESVVLVESLKSNSNLILDAPKQKKLDSFAIDFAFQGF